ncbi:MAG TPA: hypothetical protein VFB12_23475 [Ktedonobacteraceae bacterium]|nr:hypothetical protein [Ktedonobacteraceae bacterium]
MTSIADGSVSIQPSAECIPSTPSWFGEVVLMAAYLRKQEVLTKISEHVRFARRRMGHYEVIDFLAVLFGYTISGEPTLEAFYARLQPFAVPFMAFFDEREQRCVLPIIGRDAWVRASRLSPLLECLILLAWTNRHGATSVAN